MCIYKDNGFNSRKDYLRDLAEQNGVELVNVIALANILGPNEDFDALVSSVEDLSYEQADVACSDNSFWSN